MDARGKSDCTNTRKCPVTRKLMLVHRRHAKLFCHRVMKRTGTKGMKTYRCQHCGSWHIGHMNWMSRTGAGGI